MTATAGMSGVIVAASSLFAASGSPLTRERWRLPAPPNLERMDRLCALSLCAVDGALLDGALGVPGDQVGVVFASAHGCHATDEEYYRRYLEGGAALTAASPRLFVYTLPSSPVGEVSIHYGLRGPGLAEVSGETAGLLAAGEGLRMLRLQRARQVLIVAAEVQTPLLRRLQGATAEARDSAVVLMLASASDESAPPVSQDLRGALRAVVPRYHPGEPQRALREAISALLAQTGVAAPVACASPAFHIDAGTLPCPLLQEEDLYPSGSGAVGALHALAQLSRCGYPAALVLAADPSGSAAAALWLATGTPSR